jgi:S-adenosyl-L-methionine hydrolase (adenosine-forming)
LEASWPRDSPREPIPKLQLSAKGITGLILALDYPFGSLISNIEAGDFAKLGYTPGDRVPLTLGSRRMVLPFVKTFSDVPLGKPLLYIDSRGQLGLAINQDSFSRIYSVKPPTPIFIPRKAR